MIKHAFPATIHGSKKNLLNFILSGSCLTPDYNDCVTCDTSGTHRSDFSGINKRCPCAPHYYDVGVLVCSPCDVTWFYYYL